MLPRNIYLSLFFAQLVAGVTLVRSVAYDRWITVVVSLALIAGATAAQRGRTWGVGLALAAATAFPVAWMLGIAPIWFCLVGAVGALPFLLTSPALARFDKRATMLFGAIAAGIGTVGAFFWKPLAELLFATFPFLQPSDHLQHGFTVMGLMAAMFVAARAILRNAPPELEAPQVRVAHAAPVRVATQELDELEEQEECVHPKTRVMH